MVHKISKINAIQCQIDGVFLYKAKEVRPSLQNTLFPFQKKAIWI